MIIFGTRGVTMTSAEGQFFCPTCQSPQHYKHRRVRRFFTLYFIPLIPLDVAGEYVECQRCQATYQPEVLQFAQQLPAPGAPAPAAAFEAEFHRAIKRVMVLMMLADGAVDDGEVRAICTVYADIARQPLDAAAVRHEADLALADGRGVEAYLRTMAHTLNDHSKELVLSAAFYVAMADGEFSPQERSEIDAIGRALGLNPSQVGKILDESYRRTHGG